MSSIKDLMPAEPVHERKLTVQTFPLDDGRIVVEGWLRDERFMDGFNWDGNERPAGIVHHLCVRFLIGGWPLTIQDAEAEMPGIPQELCATTRESVKKVIGVQIVSGYTDEIRRRMGGVEGCTHMTHLAGVMGPAALHGFWAQASRERRPLPKSFEEIPGLRFLVNSCALWAEDGPFIRDIKKKLAEFHAEEE